MTTIHCFYLEGDTPEDVHGVQLRERVVKEVKSKKLDVKGFIRNLKGEPKVLIKCKGIEPEIGKFKALLEEIANDKQYKGAITVKGPGQINAKEALEDDGFEQRFSDFKLIREDELTEMVWALQGAGKLFLQSAKLQEKLLFRMDELMNKLDERDKTKEWVSLYALNRELTEADSTITEFIAKLRSTNTLPSIPEISCISLQHCREVPPFKNEGFISQVVGLSLKLRVPHLREIAEDSIKGEPQKLKALVYLEGLNKDITGLIGIIDLRLNDMGNRPAEGLNKADKLQ